mmetsp:Transcript_43668/g.120881  ORF Transcript_43668/g.120881 Transcript_43668/m.120881 type:complete len:627 (+) Transcript_43668:146-2026(+)
MRRRACTSVATGAPRLPRRKLDAISEQRVIKAGILVLSRRLMPQEDCARLLDLPKRPNGSSKLLRSSFFERLLANEVRLEASMSNDVVAAQSDLRHLSLEQLVVMRSRTLDFATESRSHVAHTNFLSTLDKCLFDSIARRHILEGRGSPKSPDAYYDLGRNMTLTLGAHSLLYGARSCEGACAEPIGECIFRTYSEPAPKDGSADVSPLPSCWALSLDPERWPGFQIALIHMGDLSVDLVAGNQAAVRSAAAGCKVAIVYDHSTGLGRDRRLHWEVVVADAASDDVLAELLRSTRSSNDSARPITLKELTMVLQSRKQYYDDAQNDDSLEPVASGDAVPIRKKLSFDRWDEASAADVPADGAPEEKCIVEGATVQVNGEAGKDACIPAPAAGHPGDTYPEALSACDASPGAVETGFPAQSTAMGGQEEAGDANVSATSARAPLQASAPQVFFIDSDGGETEDSDHSRPTSPCSPRMPALVDNASVARVPAGGAARVAWPLDVQCELSNGVPRRSRRSATYPDVAASWLCPRAETVCFCGATTRSFAQPFVPGGDRAKPAWPAQGFAAVESAALQKPQFPETSRSHHEVGVFDMPEPHLPPAVAAPAIRRMTVSALPLPRLECLPRA